MSEAPHFSNVVTAALIVLIENGLTLMHMPRLLTNSEFREQCLIRGRLGESWGFMAFQYDEKGPEHPAWLFTSPALPQKFPELDAFEGEAYQRRLIPARVGQRLVLAHIYAGRFFE